MGLFCVHCDEWLDDPDEVMHDACLDLYDVE